MDTVFQVTLLEIAKMINDSNNNRNHLDVHQEENSQIKCGVFIQYNTYVSENNELDLHVSVCVISKHNAGHKKNVSCILINRVLKI